MYSILFLLAFVWVRCDNIRVPLTLQLCNDPGTSATCGERAGTSAIQKCCEVWRGEAVKTFYILSDITILISWEIENSWVVHVGSCHDEQLLSESGSRWAEDMEAGGEPSLGIISVIHWGWHDLDRGQSVELEHKRISLDKSGEKGMIFKFSWSTIFVFLHCCITGARRIKEINRCN